MCTDETDRDKFFSLLISSTLDNFGFRRDIVSHRAKHLVFLSETAFEKMSCDQSAKLIYAGSSAEGAGLNDSDVDVMCVLPDSVCVDHGALFDHLNVLQTDYSDTPPGYTKLELLHASVNSTIGRCLLLSNRYQSLRGYPYISSLVLKKIVFQMIDHTPYGDLYSVDGRTTNGPAYTCNVGLSSVRRDIDRVPSFYYYGKDLFQRIKRIKSNYWPPKDTVKEISEMEGYVVPVGMKESENENLEWRVCYTTAELKLVSSLNDVQMKLYILLKMIAKHIKQKCKPFTSYIVKNVVFWVAEGSKESQTSPDLLIFLIKKSLHFIKHCLLNNFLPNYMIPERNLFIGAFSKQDKCSLLTVITEYLETDLLSYIFNTNVKLKKCVSYLYTCPYFVYQYGKWRDEVEIQFDSSVRKICEDIDVIDILNKRSQMSDLITEFCKRSDQTVHCIKLVRLLCPEIFHGRVLSSEQMYERMKLLHIL